MKLKAGDQGEEEFGERHASVRDRKRQYIVK